MDEIVRKLLDEDLFIPTLAGGCIVLIILIRTVASVAKTSAKERTRREIAAYIAEGSMSPEQGERLLKAGPRDA